MKKIRLYTISIILSLLFAGLTAYAASGVIYFSDPESTAGGTVTVTMTVQAEGTGIGDATVTLKYPSESLVFVDGDKTSGGAGTLRVHGITDGASQGKCDYALKFQTPAAGNFTVSLDTYEVYDPNGQSIEIAHAGSSAVTVSAAEGLSGDSTLSVLTVSPGELTPAFSPDVYEYTLSAGLSVDSLIINAISSQTDARVNITGNQELAEGENEIIIFVTAPDGAGQSEYHLFVTKEQGGAENETDTVPAQETESFADGVQLISKGKTVTVMTPDEGTEIPEGFKESAISIDGQKVQGWIWGAEGTPQYCVVYGMNDQGEVNFYRYDMNEKTIQRYFEDPMAADCIALTEYNELASTVGTLTEELEERKLIMIILGIVAALMLVIVIYLIIRISQVQRKQRAEEEPEKEDEPEAIPEDETRVIVRNERRRRVREQAEDETIVIKSNNQEEVQETEDDGFEDLDF